MSHGILILSIGMLILAAVLLAVMIIDGSRFHIVEYVVYTDKIKREHRYAVLSDLHNKSYGKKNERLLNSIHRLQPEAILSAGDILTAKPKESYETASDLMKRLAEKYPIYYGMGNHETRLFLYPETYGDMGKEYEKELNQVQIEFMRNSSAECEDNIRITGLELEREYYRRFHKKAMEREYLKRVLPESSGQRFEILLAHNPEYFEEYADWGADLVLSGHVHGGILRLPFLGGVISPSLRLFPKYDGGLFCHNNSKMILSRGLGMHTLPVRIFNPGELILLRLCPADKA